MNAFGTFLEVINRTKGNKHNEMFLSKVVIINKTNSTGVPPKEEFNENR